MPNIGIYLIISPTYKVYIGQTVNFEERCKRYRSNCKGQHKLQNSFLKYGIESHSISLLFECAKNELNYWEEFYVRLFNSTDKEYGLNIRYGGGGRGKLSEETKLKIGKKKIGVKREKFSQEWIDNIRNSHKKIVKSDTWLHNLKLAAEKRVKDGGYVITESQKAKFRESYSKYLQTERGKSRIDKTKVKVDQYDVNGVFIKTWDGLSDVCREYGCIAGNLYKVLNGVGKTLVGYKWTYNKTKVA